MPDEDHTPLDISGDPPAATPMNQKQVAGAQKAQVNRTRAASPTQAQDPRAEDLPGSQTTSDIPQSSQRSSQPSETPAPQKGIGPAWQALTQGLGDILHNPEWTQHPLLRLFSDPTSDPSQMGQDLWSATQWWGRVVNAALDPNAIHASAANIAHDNSIQGRIAQSLFGIHDDPISQFAWNIIPQGLSMAAEWPFWWAWGPQMAAGGPGQLSQVPQAAMSLFGQDLQHPQLEDPAWYQRMGSYALAAVLASRGGGSAAKGVLDFSGRLKVLEPFAAQAERWLGGKVTKTPIDPKGPEGATYDPASDPRGAAHAQWWSTFVAPLAESETPFAKAAQKPLDQLISDPEIEGAYHKTPLDPTAQPEFAKALGLDAKASAETIKHHFFAMLENRALTPRASEAIVKQWKRFGGVIGQTGKLNYWHPGDAPLRDVFESLYGIDNPQLRSAAQKAMSAANGIHADLHSGIHGYGNDLSEALVKGILNHGRTTDHYFSEMLTHLSEVLPTEAERIRVMQGVESPELYSELSPHEKWAVDFYRRLSAEIRLAKAAAGRQFEALPNFAYRVPKRIGNLEQVLKGVDPKLRAKVTGIYRRTPFAYVAKEHRAFQLVASPEGEIRAEPAYATTQESNAARQGWREQLAADLRREAAKDPALQAIVDDPKKLEALLQAEIPDYSRDIMDSLGGSGDRGMLPDIRALYTHQVLKNAQSTLVLNDKDGRWHPLVVARSESGQESSPTLAQHFKQLHSADTTTDFYKTEGWKAIEGFGAGHIFHPSFADPLNRSIEFATSSAARFRFLRKLSSVGKHLIMFNPMWHSTNMMGRFAWLTGTHPVAMANALLKARGLKELNQTEAAQWWQAQEYERMAHGGLPPQMNSDVLNTAGRYHMLATGDIETGTPLDQKQPLTGFADPAKAALADAIGAIKGVDSWWQHHVNARMWAKINDFNTLAYIALKDDAVHRGMGPGDARLFAAGQANAWAGMVSPDRWMNNPSLHAFSQVALFAPNWWRTFPRLILNSYDHLGMKSDPALTHAWALNTAKTIGMMVLLKASSDNALNWLLSGHWQFQNGPGYQNQITMDRFGGVDPKTGAHLVAENPFERQVTDLERAFGLEEAMKEGHWAPEYAAEGVTEVGLARMSPVFQALETGSNIDLYNSIKERALRWVDPLHPYPLSSAAAVLAGVLNLTPMGYSAQAALGGVTAQPQTITQGPFAGQTVPGWAARAFDPGDPLVPLLSLLGVRGGYPAPVRDDQRGLSSDEIQQLIKYKNDWQGFLTKQQTAITSGGESLSDFAYNYKQQSVYHAGEIAGLTGGTSNYLYGAEGLLSQYEAIYGAPQATDAYGDTNWDYITRAQGQLQAKVLSQPDGQATWNQMLALKNQSEMQFPVLRVYKDSIQNYHNFQDSFAKANGSDGEQLRNLIAQAAGSANFQQFEAANPLLAQFYNARRQWELNTKQGFFYGMFTNNSYVMEALQSWAGGSDPQQIAAAEDKLLPQVEQMEQQGQFVTPTGG